LEEIWPFLPRRIKRVFPWLGYGIDTPTREELISTKYSPKEIADMMSADSLGFLSIEGLKRALGDDRRYSLVSFDGNYFAGGNADSAGCVDCFE